MTALHVQTSTRDHGTVLAVIGPVTAHTARQLREHIRRVVDDQPTGTAVHVDLRCCTELDAPGLMALDAATRAAARRGAVVHLVNVPPLLTLVVQRYHFDHLLAPDAP